MSSEVHAKWMNSATLVTSAFFARRSLSRYSTALTSWLVVASIALTRAPSVSEKFLTSASSSASGRGGECGDFFQCGFRGQGFEPLDFDAHALPDQRLFAEAVAQCAEFAVVAAIERGEGVQGRQWHRMTFGMGTGFYHVALHVLSPASAIRCA